MSTLAICIGDTLVVLSGSKCLSEKSWLHLPGKRQVFILSSRGHHWTWFYWTTFVQSLVEKMVGLQFQTSFLEEANYLVLLLLFLRSGYWIAFIMLADDLW